MQFTASDLSKISFQDSIASANRGKAASLTSMYGLKTARNIVGDARLHDSQFAYLSTSLANLHNALVEPKFFVTYLRDIDVKYGGGFVDYSVYYAVNWNGLIDEMRAIGANNSNYLPRVNASLTKEQVDVYTYEVGYDLRFVELEKLKKLELQKSLEEIYQNAITAGWDLFVQRITYLGMDGTKGLFTSDRVKKYTISNTTATQGFKGLKDEEIVAIFNNIFTTYLQETGGNFQLFPDKILVPSFIGSEMTGRMNALYNSTLRNFISKFNLAVDESNGTIESISIESRRDLDNLGTGGKGRIVAYKKDESFARIDVPYPIQHFNTLPNIEKMAYTSVFVGQVSAVQLPYNTSNKEFGVVTYWDLTK